MSPLPRSTIAGYALLAVVVLVLGGRWIATRGGADAVRAGAGAPPAGASLRVSPTPVRSAVVDVTGAVRRPGVYRLAASARVRDALARAGGATRAADTATVNLAAKLADGQQIVVPGRAAACGGGGGAAAAPAAASGAAARAPVSLAAATLEQLDALPGVGPAIAQKIVDWRAQHGGFTSVEDLGQVPGIGPKKLAALKPLVQP